MRDFLRGRRWAWVLLAGMGVLVALGQDAPPPALYTGVGNSLTLPPRGITEERLAAEDRRIEAFLDGWAAEAHFAEATLDQVAAWAAEGGGFNVFVNWTNLEDAGLARDKRLSLNMRGVPRWRVLQLAFERLTGGELRLGFEARGGVLLIGTYDWINKEMVTRIYPIRELVARQAAECARVWQARSLIVETDSLESPAGLGGLSAEDLAKSTDPGYRERMAARLRVGGHPADLSTAMSGSLDQAFWNAAEEDLLTLIREVVEPDSWRENGGAATAHFWNGNLVVRQPRSVQRELERFLLDLRAAK